MKHLLIVVLFFSISTGFAQLAPTQTSLFERLGGTEGITAIVDEAVAVHMTNPTIQAVFLPYAEEPERLAVIKKHTVDFFSAGTGGDITLT